MGGLFHTLGIGAESLHASRQGVDTSGHNIANAHTDGYSRQTVNLEAREPSETRGVIIGNGVFVKNIMRSHDRFLEKQINHTNSDQGSASARHDELKALEGIFSHEMSASISDEVSQFFNSLQNLANFPEELTVRTHVRESAANLLTSFKRVDHDLRQHQSDLNSKIEAETREMSAILSEVARLNIAIQNMEASDHRQANDLRDQQDRLVRELTKKTNAYYYRGDHGMLTIRGPGETLLVDMGLAAKFEVSKRLDGSNLFNVMVVDPEGNATRDVTQGIHSGRLRGLVEVRDEVIGRLLHDNNLMAHTLANEFNAVHRQGFGIKDFKAATGRNFFDLPDDVAFAAREIKLADVISQSTDAIAAASSPDAPGDNIIVNELLRLKGKKMLDNGNATVTDYYANSIGVLGIEVVRSQHAKQATDILLGDLTARREAISGVSVDEEAMNLMRWQANFTASSKVITTVDEMLETVLAMKR